MSIFTKKLDESLQKIGLQMTAAKLLKYSHTKLLIKNLTPTLIEILKDQPVVVMGNHPFEAEPIVLIASLPPRKNVKLIINSDFMNISKELDKHLIPVYVAHHPHEKGRDFLGLIYNTIFPVKKNSQEKAQQKNRESISKAAKYIKKGEMILIFPGKRGVNGKWFSGIGHLLKGVGDNKVFVVNCYIEGTSPLDRLRFIKGIGFLLPKITVTFGKAEDFKYQRYDGKEIVHKLEEDYNGWFESLR